jgi:transketolase
MREAYGLALAEYGALDPRVVALDADTACSTLSGHFARRFPERFFNVGIAEPCMVDVAVGLALGGFVPFANAFACLLALRALDAIRTSVCLARTNVKLAASYAGLSDYKDGATHFSISDLANLRALPEMTVIVPADAVEAAAWVPIVARHEGPVWLRISRAATLPVHAPSFQPTLGRAVLLRPGDDLCLVTCGAMTGRCLLAAERLAAEGIAARVLEVHTIKPLDREALLQAAEETGCLVSVEEHSVLGGLGSAVAELLCEERPTPLLRVGIPDTFCPTGFEPEGLLDAVGLSVDDIMAAARRALGRKGTPGRGRA